MANDNESPPSYNGAEATNATIFSSMNIKMHSPILAVVIISPLVRKKCKHVEVKDQQDVYLSMSINEEVISKEKLAGVFEDVMKPKLVPRLEDNVYMHK